MSKDVFKDLGFSAEESAEMRLRYELMEALLRVIDKHKYTQAELGIILRQKQPHVSSIARGKISQFISEKIASFLDALNAKVQVKAQRLGKKLNVPEG